MESENKCKRCGERFHGPSEFCRECNDFLFPSRDIIEQGERDATEERERRGHSRLD